MEIEAILCSS